MFQAGLFAKYTMDEVLDELDSIECFIEPGKAPIQGEVLAKQEQLYRDLGVTPLLAAPENRWLVKRGQMTRYVFRESRSHTCCIPLLLLKCDWIYFCLAYNTNKGYLIFIFHLGPVTMSYETSDSVNNVKAPFRMVVIILKRERNAFLSRFSGHLLRDMNSSKASRHSAIAVTACNVLAGDSVSSISQSVKNVG